MYRFITESTSDIVSGDYGGQSAKMIYAVFTTPRNSISANAICAFRIRDLLDTFEGAFKEQETANSNWLPVPKIKEPLPRYYLRLWAEKRALFKRILHIVRIEPLG